MNVIILIHLAIMSIGDKEAINGKQRGTKAGAWCRFGGVPPGRQVVLRSRLYQDDVIEKRFDRDAFDDVIDSRRREADVFYESLLIGNKLSEEEANVARQACAGLLWGKQFYHYIVKDWLGGDQ